MRRPPFVSRWLLAIVLALVTVATPVAQSAAQAAAIWQLGVGASSPDQAVQVNYFLPNQIWINAGDTINWTWHSGEIHTVSFLNGQPPAFNPFSSFGGSTYDGTAQASSGVLSRFFPVSSYHLTFTRAGDYQFNCLVHPPMSGIVHVRPAGALLPHNQGYYDQLAQAATAQRLAQGTQLMATGLQSTHYAQDTAGIGTQQDTGSLAVLRFLPQTLTVKVNETVTFTNRDAQTPHTVTFGPAGGVSNEALPFGIDGPGHATVSTTGQVASSGFLWSSPLPGFPSFGTAFAVKFTAPGTYNFHCELHDDLGMTGTVNVTN